MARPIMLDAKLSYRIVDLIKYGATRAEIATWTGVSSRSLQYWLARGRRGEAPFDRFAAEFDDAAEFARRIHFLVQYRREREASKLRWQAYKSSRERWWLDRLGPAAFWARRLLWCLAEGKSRGAARARAELTALIEAEARRRRSE